MKLAILLVLLILALLIIILYRSYTKHYWFNVLKSLDEDEYFNDDKFNNGAKVEKDISKINLDDLERLYKDYFHSIEIKKSNIQNFFNYMEKPVIIYKKEENKYIASMFNTINRVIYNNSIKTINFVDYGVVDKNQRHTNIYQGLMNEVARYTNKDKTELIIFKIDLKPIPSFGEYNFSSDYYGSVKIDMENPISNIEKRDLSENELKWIIDLLKNNFKFYPVLDNNSNLKNILRIDDERLTFIIDNKVIFNCKYNSTDNLEILYVFSKDDDLIIEGLKYIMNNCKFKYLLIDDIGYNSKVIEKYSDILSKKHITYHYILGIDEKLKKDDIYYYF